VAVLNAKIKVCLFVLLSRWLGRLQQQLRLVWILIRSFLHILQALELETLVESKLGDLVSGCVNIAKLEQVYQRDHFVEKQVLDAHPHDLQVHVCLSGDPLDMPSTIYQRVNLFLQDITGLIDSFLVTFLNA